jgi:hypothetical protein
VAVHDALAAPQLAAGVRALRRPRCPTA